MHFFGWEDIKNSREKDVFFLSSELLLSRIRKEKVEKIISNYDFICPFNFQNLVRFSHQSKTRNDPINTDKNTVDNFLVRRKVDERACLHTHHGKYRLGFVTKDTASV